MIETLISIWHIIGLVMGYLIGQPMLIFVLIRDFRFSYARPSWWVVKGLVIIHVESHVVSCHSLSDHLISSSLWQRLIIVSWMKSSTASLCILLARYMYSAKKVSCNLCAYDIMYVTAYLFVCTFINRLLLQEQMYPGQ